MQRKDARRFWWRDRAVSYFHDRTGILHLPDEGAFSSHTTNGQDDRGENHSLKVFSKRRVTDITHKGRALMVPHGPSAHLRLYHQYRCHRDDVSMWILLLYYTSFLFYVYGCFACHACMCFTCMLKEARSVCSLSWDWSYKQLQASIWVLGIECPSSGRATSALNCMDISLAPQYTS